MLGIRFQRWIHNSDDLCWNSIVYQIDSMLGASLLINNNYYQLNELNPIGYDTNIINELIEGYEYFEID